MLTETLAYAQSEQETIRIKSKIKERKDKLNQAA